VRFQSATPVSGQWHSWLAQTLDKRQVEGSSPSCPTICAYGETDIIRVF
jgi:hypothetical protein